VWFDEEPPYSIYGEGLTRTNKYGQFSILTFTPLMGMSDVVTKFLKNPSKSQKVVNMTIYDAEHYTDEQKEQIIASYPEHEREARARGIPTMGSGRIFQIPEETIKCQPFECPDHFYVIGGMDFGWDHPQRPGFSERSLSGQAAYNRHPTNGKEAGNARRLLI
jgi:phage terminase large subunit-like protein